MASISRSLLECEHSVVDDIETLLMFYYVVDETRFYFDLADLYNEVMVRFLYLKGLRI